MHMKNVFKQSNIIHKNNTTGSISEAGTSYATGASEFAPVVKWGLRCSYRPNTHLQSLVVNSMYEDTWSIITPNCFPKYLCYLCMHTGVQHDFNTT
jgi:hypothetical protein